MTAATLACAAPFVNRQSATVYGAAMTAAEERRRQDAENALADAITRMEDAARAEAEARDDRDRAVHRLARAMGHGKKRGVIPEIARRSGLSLSLVKLILDRPEPRPGAARRKGGSSHEH